MPMNATISTAAPTATPEQQQKLRMAARALGRAGLVHAYGHCSLRLSKDYFLTCAPEPMATLLPEEEGTVVPVDGELPESVLGEVRIHQYIYQKHPDVNAVCRIMPPNVMTLSTQAITPRARHGLGAYFGKEIPLWHDPRLLRNDAAAQALVEQMSDCHAVVMRGNGAVVSGDSIEQAVAFAWYLEDSARIELAVRSMHDGFTEMALDDEELVDRYVTTGRVFDRMWRHLTHGDPELNS